MFVFFSPGRNFFDPYARVNDGFQLPNFANVVDRLRVNSRIDFVAESLSNGWELNAVVDFLGLPNFGVVVRRGVRFTYLADRVVRFFHRRFVGTFFDFHMFPRFNVLRERAVVMHARQIAVSRSANFVVFSRYLCLFRQCTKGVRYAEPCPFVFPWGVVFVCLILVVFVAIRSFEGCDSFFDVDQGRV